LGQEISATCIMVRENVQFSGILIPREIDPKGGTLEDSDGGNMSPRE